MNSKAIVVNVVCVIVGVVVTVIFYPSKTIKEKYQKQVDTLQQEKKELTSRLVSVSQENINLKQNIKERIVVVRAKDGTETITTDREVTNDQENIKVSRDETSKHEVATNNNSTSTTEQKDRLVEINKKLFTLEVGVDTERDIYGHITASVFKGIFIGVDYEFKKRQAGVGLGVSF